MKKILLTLDYEIYFGDITGSVKECMIDPTNRLLKILDMNDSKMTVFWDILHFYKLLELQDEFPELKKERIAIQNQIHKIVQKGHDIQLHLHPHWLDAKYIEGKWSFVYDRFKLHTLSKINDPNDINTIVGCIIIAKNLMEKIVREADKNYNVNSFRAGGYLIEPFNELKDIFYDNGIFIDSSICPNLKNDSNIYAFNYNKYPKKQHYRFIDNISIIDDEGYFIEFPITTFKIPFLVRLYFTFLKRYKYKNFKSGRKGNGSESVNKNDIKLLQKMHNYYFDKRYDKLTTDDSFIEKYNYLIKRADNYSNQILHPKMLNEHAFSIFESKTLKDKIKFISIKDFLKLNSIN